MLANVWSSCELGKWECECRVSQLPGEMVCVELVFDADTNISSQRDRAMFTMFQHRLELIDSSETARRCGGI